MGSKMINFLILYLRKVKLASLFILVFLTGCIPTSKLINLDSGSHKFFFEDKNVEILIKGKANPYNATFDVTIKNKKNNSIYIDYDKDFLLKIIETDFHPELNIGREVSPESPESFEDIRIKEQLKSSILKTNEETKGKVYFAYRIPENYRFYYFFHPDDELLLIINGLQDTITGEKIHIETKFKVK